MALGPGPYDKLCGWALERAKAEGLVLVVYGGEKGNGASVKVSIDMTPGQVCEIAHNLRRLADAMQEEAVAVLEAAQRGKN